MSSENLEGESWVFCVTPGIERVVACLSLWAQLWEEDRFLFSLKKGLIAEMVMTDVYQLGWNIQILFFNWMDLLRATRL